MEDDATIQHERAVKFGFPHRWYACCFNGEGMCYLTLTGPGTAWVQSMPWARFKKHMSVIIQLDKDGNVKNVGGPPAAEMARN